MSQVLEKKYSGSLHGLQSAWSAFWGTVTEIKAKFSLSVDLWKAIDWGRLHPA